MTWRRRGTGRRMKRKWKRKRKGGRAETDRQRGREVERQRIYVSE